ncbi:hypothetical protein Vadar_019796 [Vaccinium darrowii]|uniref:Uncharacterized protein n=1 Tax=Vaccinium darrowii TaxID=229202 RepID=A0ACB7X2K3_9ERIC|nr:hypothetical protein Vadar_019796 [Vaccinium darrowii]
MAMVDDSSGAFVIDEAYEFSAPRFFNFIEGETVEEMRVAEVWFDTALTYAPSRTFFDLIFLSWKSLDNSSGAFVIDEAYEFLAPRFFDFIEGETVEDMRVAELWFDTALAYAPSRTFLDLIYLSWKSFHLIRVVLEF